MIRQLVVIPRGGGAYVVLDFWGNANTYGVDPWLELRSFGAIVQVQDCWTQDHAVQISNLSLAGL